jgi:hypothetical protein
MFLIFLTIAVIYGDDSLRRGKGYIGIDTVKTSGSTRSTGFAVPANPVDILIVQ